MERHWRRTDHYRGVWHLCITRDGLWLTIFLCKCLECIRVYHVHHYFVRCAYFLFWFFLLINISRYDWTSIFMVVYLTTINTDIQSHRLFRGLCPPPPTLFKWSLAWCMLLRLKKYLNRPSKRGQKAFNQRNATIRHIKEDRHPWQWRWWWRRRLDNDVHTCPRSRFQRQQTKAVTFFEKKISP